MTDEEFHTYILQGAISMTERDRQLANAIREAAEKLCTALNEAGAARLRINIEFYPGFHFDGETGNWLFQISITRSITL